MNKIALIPAFEPDDVLLELLEKLQSIGFEIVVVDDGSGLNFRDTFRRSRQYATVLTNMENHGKGYSLKIGLLYIQETYVGDYVVVTLDADGQHKVKDALHACTNAALYSDALVLGCRSFTGNVPLRSRLGNLITRGVFRLSTGKKISDTQTGLRAFDSSLIPFLLQIQGERYEYEMNMLMEAARQKRTIREIEIDTVYLDDNSSSHFDTVRDSYRIYKEILRFVASSFSSFLVDYGVYSLLVVLSAGLGAASIPVSNVVARVFSASFNFTLNKKLVFRSKRSLAHTGAQYFVLAALILTGNTVLLSWLVSGLGVNAFAAKIVTEATFFIFSWSAQKFFIFRKDSHPLGSKVGIKGGMGV